MVVRLTQHTENSAALTSVEEERKKEQESGSGECGVTLAGGSPLIRAQPCLAYPESAVRPLSHTAWQGLTVTRLKGQPVPQSSRVVILTLGREGEESLPRKRAGVPVGGVQA